MSQHVNDLKHQIERVLQWEPAEHWELRDFAFLSEQVLAYTDCWLEAQDLQLFWQSSVTTPGLLDALAQFVDYDDWDAWCASNSVGKMAPNREVAWLYSPKSETPASWVVWILWLSGLASVAVAALLLWKH